jgi:cytochrome c oxidase subunit 3
MNPGVGTPGQQRGASFTGLYALLASIVMLFGALTSALVVRSAAKDWQGTPVPDLLWPNTAILLVSSLTAELARRARRRNERSQFNVWWTLTTILGAVFVGGQFFLWQQLRHSGVYLNTHPGSAFFYLFTMAHALHLGGGWLRMAYLCFRALRLELGPSRRTAVDVAIIYWHFLGVLWLYLLVVFHFWGSRAL